ncbi:MAG: hypothetical protein HKP60_03200 [Eudoraea sp.]|nr:DoxX family protein [Eudoraea sp.]NNJ39857.1 hypothetical protein [Eudoraea sp.]
MNYPWHYYLMAIFYIVAGTGHFIKPKWYLRVMPPHYPSPGKLVMLTGILEIGLGALLFFPALKNWGLYGIMGMLVLFLSVHTHMLKSKEAAAGIPRWILILRLPLQFVLMYWAYSYLTL